MKILKINSKTHGTFKIKLDDEDYLKATTTWRTPKWCVRKCKDRHSLYYFQKRIPGGRLIELHRWIMGEPNGEIVDHINGDTLDNRKSNLRITTNGSNIRKGKIRTNNKSGITGVRFRKERNRWVASIKVNYKKINLGSFKNKEDAIKARREAEKKYYDS